MAMHWKVTMWPGHDVTNLLLDYLTRPCRGVASTVPEFVLNTGLRRLNIVELLSPHSLLIPLWYDVAYLDHDNDDDDDDVI